MIWLTTSEAAEYIGAKTPSAIRQAVHRGEIVPDGVGARGTLLFLQETLDRMIQARFSRRMRRLERSGKGIIHGEEAPRHPPIGKQQVSNPSVHRGHSDQQEKGERSNGQVPFSTRGTSTTGQAEGGVRGRSKPAARPAIGKAVNGRLRGIVASTAKTAKGPEPLDIASVRRASGRDE